MSASADLHIEHTSVLRMVRVLEAFRDRMEKGEIPERDDFASAVEFLRVFVDRCHHGKEEQLLFPALTEAGDADMQRLIEQLMKEHKIGRGHVAALVAAVGLDAGLSGKESEERQVDVARASHAISSYVELIRPHVVTEEKTVFPAADRLLSPSVQERLEQGYERIEAEVIGPGRHEEFQTMLRDLKARYWPQ